MSIDLNPGKISSCSPCQWPLLDALSRLPNVAQQLIRDVG
jgi:hypothetical protein